VFVVMLRASRRGMRAVIRPRAGPSQDFGPRTKAGSPADPFRTDPEVL